MNLSKRILALMLAAVMFFSAFPVGASANEVSQEVNTGNMTAEGYNGFGNLLSDVINQEQSKETQYDGRYTVSDLEIQGNTATVTYDAAEEAMLIVALYSEDGLQMLTSAKTAVMPENTEAVVTFEGTMPEYFLASAYLVDDYDFSPLCEVYETPMYTKDMQELLDSTIYDYSTDRVLNLDEDETTNFAVFSDATKIIEYSEGTNTVISADSENGIYVFGNINEDIGALVEGDIFAYIYGDNQMIIAKVATTYYEDGTITITAADMEMQEAFQAIKIESSGDTADMVVDEDSLGEGITYLGMVHNTDPQQVMPMDQGSEEVGDSFKFGISENIVNHDNFKVNVSGFVEYGITLKFEYYVTMIRQHIELKLDYNLKFAVTFSGTLEWDVKMCDVSFRPIPVLGIGLEPTLHMEIGGKVSINTTVGGAVGMVYDDQTGLEFIRTSPTVESKTEFEGTAFVGIDFKPQVEVVEGAVAEVEMKLPFGFEATFKPNGNNGVPTTGSEEIYHKCKDCLDIELFMKLELGIECSFLKIFKVERTLTALKFRLGYFYYSLDKNIFNVGHCDNFVYRLIVAVEDFEGNPVADMPVVVKNQQKNTNEHGNAIFYLPDGAYKASCEFDGSTADHIFVLDQAKKVTLREKAPKEPENIFEEKQENPEEEDPFHGTVDESGVIGFGTCGNNLNWVLDGDGTLTISGTGKMDTYQMTEAPWYPYADKIIEVVVGDGVTSVSAGAFYCCDSILEISLGNSVSEFNLDITECLNLYAIRVSEDNPYYSSDGRGVLFDKEKQVLIRAPRGIIGEYAIPGGVVTIAEAAFWNCPKLTSVTVPLGVETIEYHAFAWCGSLKEVVFYGNAPAMDEIFFDVTATAYYPENNMTWTSGVMQNYGGNITWVAQFQIDAVVVASGYCGYGTESPLWTLYSNGLMTITGTGEIQYIGGWEARKEMITDLRIGEGVTSVCDYAFRLCTNIETVSLPNTLKSIGFNAFNYCSSLKHVTIPDSVQKIDGGAFMNCFGMKTLIIGSGVTTMLSAFGYCGGLEAVIFRCGEIETIDSGNFWEVATDAYYPAGTWSEEARVKFSKKLNWIPYTLDENGEMILPTATDNSAEEVTDSRGDILSPNAIYGGEYSSEIADKYIHKTASFSGLVPGAEYLLLALKSIEAEEPLGAENLLYVDQGTALADGTLVFTYVPRENTAVSYVIACGPSNKNLKDAEITFPEMTADGEVQVVDPLVVYKGKTLVEDRDYVITGDVSFAEAGTYTCVIQGIRNYTGTVECTYTVDPGTSEEPEVPENPQYAVQFSSATVSLGGNIGLNFYVKMSDSMANNPNTHARFTLDGRTIDVPIAEAVISQDNGTTLYRFTCPVTSKNMTDIVTAQFMVGDQEIGESRQTYVADYAAWVIETSKDPEMVALMKAMLNYGASAQVLFNHNTDNLANEALPEAEKVFPRVDASAFDHSVTGQEEGIVPDSSTLMLDSETAIRVYFRLTGSKTIDAFTFTVDGAPATPVYANGMYYIELPNIGAHRLDDMHVFTCGNITVTYGALSYVNQIMEYDPEGSPVFNMGSALYAYSMAAEAYIK